MKFLSKRFDPDFYDRWFCSACQICTPNATNVVWSDCQCVLADGVERGILTANRMIPGPSIQVCQGDKVVIDVENHIEGMEVTIHWHGVWQRGSQYYDGVPFVTQCPIQEGSTFRYLIIESILVSRQDSIQRFSKFLSKLNQSTNWSKFLTNQVPMDCWKRRYALLARPHRIAENGRSVRKHSDTSTA